MSRQFIVQFNIVDNPQPSNINFTCESKTFETKEGAFYFATKNKGIVNEVFRTGLLMKLVPIANFR